jgi:hypothetical protein
MRGIRRIRGIGRIRGKVGEEGEREGGCRCGALVRGECAAGWK